MYYHIALHQQQTINYNTLTDCKMQVLVLGRCLLIQKNNTQKNTQKWVFITRG